MPFVETALKNAFLHPFVLRYTTDSFVLSGRVPRLARTKLTSSP